jgi:tetratricopeptide (TPR) repeat protein
MTIGEIFISHTHADREIADALSAAIEGVFGGLLTTSYSTKKELDGGIKPGEEWFRWIVGRVHSAKIAVILLTPASIQKPWVLWEAGAVYGAGIASAETGVRKVRPLVFKLSGSQVPSPFAGIQGVNGDDRSGIERFLRDLLDDFSKDMAPAQVFKAGEKLGATIGIYLEQVEKALRDAPLLPTEAAVQEWCERLDKLAEDRRLSEVGYLHDWLNLTFGRGRDEQPLPLDLRLHRRLGEAYRDSKRPDRAAEEFQLELEFALRDIFLLRALGLAYLDADRVDDAAKVIDRITNLDKDAFSHNVECAALKARLQRGCHDFEGAALTYRQALERNPNSYYLADILGQTLLQLGRLDEARGAYRRAGDIIDQLSERNLWTHATRVTAALMLGDEPRALRHLKAIAALRPPPSPGDVKRIEEGLERLQKGLNLDGAALERWRAALKGEA